MVMHRVSSSKLKVASARERERRGYEAALDAIRYSF
jgi:hypothetical protein